MKSLCRCVLTALLLSLAVACAGRPATTPAAGDPAVAAEFQAIIETLAAPEMEGRDAGTAGVELARDYLIQRFEAIGLQPGFVVEGSPSYAQPFAIKTGADAEGKPIQVTAHNVGAILPGVGPLAEQVLVVGGHYDHVGYGHYGSRAKASGTIHPGADDNASGTAGVVLLAQRMAAYAKANPDTSRRTVLFACFAGEERGLLGSRYMVASPEQWPFKAEALAGMINMDMIGRLTDNDLYLFGDMTGRQWREWTVAINQEQNLGLNLKLDVPPPGGSDHSMFIAAGCPAIFFNTWLHADYHTPTDTPDKINALGGAAVIELIGGLLEKAATTDERVTFVAPPAPAPRPVLGVQSDRVEQGVRITGVADASPAAEAGLQLGDIITALAGTPVATPGELRREIARHKVGEEVVVTLLRAGEVMEVTVKLGSR